MQQSDPIAAVSELLGVDAAYRKAGVAIGQGSGVASENKELSWRQSGPIGEREVDRVGELEQTEVERN